MQINTINSSDTNFRGLYASKKTLKAIGCTRKELLNNYSIRKASEKYDVLVKAGNRDVDKFDPWWPMNMYFRTIGSCMAAGIAGGIAAFCCTDVAAAGFWNFFPWCAIPTFSVLGLNYLYDKQKCKPVKEIVIQAGKGVDVNEDYIENCGTREHVIEHPDTDLPLTEEVKEAETEAFNRKIRTYDTDDLFSAKKYLTALKNADIELLGGGDFFNRPIDRMGNTMLTQFFDVIPTKENQQEYREILHILSGVSGINYNQKDGNGISCIEKIINSENKQVLPMIYGQNFDYSPEIEIVYNHIQDESFKKAFDKNNIKFNFNDILDAVKLNSWHVLTQLRYRLNSPLCNREYLANQVKEILEAKQKRPQTRSDYTAYDYVNKYYNEYVNPNKYVPVVEVNPDM